MRVRAFLIPTGLSSAAFLWCWTTGSRGFFALDQSIALDGGWRILNGQVPFVDFSTPHGVPLLAALALAFKAFGADHATYLGFAAAQSALATWLAWSLALRWTGRRWLAAVAGLGTALWLQAPHGTPFSEQTAFLCALACWHALASRRRPGTLQLVAAGALALLAILCKQNAGVLSLAISLWVLLDRARASGDVWGQSWRFAAGFGAVGIGFASWLVLASDPVSFWNSYVTIPSGLLGPRLIRPDALRTLFLSTGQEEAPYSTLAACLPPCVAWLRGGARAGEARFRAVLCLGLHFHHTLFTILTFNHPENGYPFVGLSLAVGASCIPDAFRGRRARRVAIVLAVLVMAWALRRGERVGWRRIVHRPVFLHAAFEERLPFDGWRHVRWGNPTVYEGESMKSDDLASLVQDLKRRPGNVFVFPERTYLYAVLGRVSPQPVLWFDVGVTYPADDASEIDALIVSDLVKNDVRTVVFEERSFLDADEHLSHLPALAAYLRDGFRETARHGPFRVLTRKNDDSHDRTD
jgi:hypothetical protein